MGRSPAVVRLRYNVPAALGTRSGVSSVGSRVDAISQDDGALARAALAGSAPARAKLFDRHLRAVWQRAYAVTGRRAMADDVAQDAFERAFRSLGRLQDPAAFGPWILRIATNRAIDLLRAERPLGPLDDAAPIAVWDPDRGGDVALRAAVAALATDRRTVLVLRYWLDLPPAEIAATLGIPTGTVHSRLARALADLRAELGEGDRD